MTSTRYEKHRDVNYVSIVNDNNDDTLDVFETPSSYFTDRDSKKLTIIAESKESSDELDEGATKDLSVPNITVNGVDLKASEEASRVANGEKSEVSLMTVVHAGNNNETSEVASTVAGPTFYGVAVVEPCSIAQIEEAVSVETPEVKVTCVREESLDKQDDSLLDATHETQENTRMETSSLDESLGNDNEQVINMWIVCQFLK